VNVRDFGRWDSGWCCRCDGVGVWSGWGSRGLGDCDGLAHGGSPFGLRILDGRGECQGVEVLRIVARDGIFGGNLREGSFPPGTGQGGQRSMGEWVRG